MPDAFDPITQTDLDALAILANSKIAKLDYASSDTDIGTTLTGNFGFASAATPVKRAWGDELDRIWCSLWDHEQIDGAYEFNAYHGVNDTLLGGVQRVNADRAHEVMRTAWWEQLRDDVRRAVVSCGPHLWTYCANIPPGATHKMFRAFRYPQFVYSRMDNPDFFLRAGFVLGTVEHPFESAIDSGSGSSADPALKSFDFDLPGAMLYGEVWFEFSHPSGTGAADPTDRDISFTGWGFGGSGVGYRDPDNGNLLLYLGNKGIVNRIDNSGVPFSGTLEFSAYVNDSGWSPVGFGMRGVIQFDSGVVDSTVDVEPSAYKVIHPRNAAARAAFHLTNNPNFDTGDFIGYDAGTLADFAFAAKIRTHSDAPSLYIYNSLAEPTKTWSVEYPGGANDSLYANALAGELNELVDGSNLKVASGTAWDGVTLRQATQWLLDLNPASGSALLRVLNRMLLEDAFPTELSRIPASDFSPADEIVQMEAPHIEISNLDGTPKYWFGEFAPGVFCTVASDEDLEAHGRISGVWVAEAWPQPFYHSFLDLDLPQYHAGPDSPSDLRIISDVKAADGVTELGEVYPTAQNQISTWPVLPVSAFGQAVYSFGYTFSGHGFKMDCRVPYWRNDSHHEWYEQGYYTLTTNQKHSSLIFISDPGAEVLLEKRRYEVGNNNPDVKVYVGAGPDVPDPDNPSTYLFSQTGRGFIFPDDFIANSLTPSDYYGANILYTFRNETLAQQTIHVEHSIFSSIAGEDPPLPEPLFFPRHDVTVADATNMRLEYGIAVPATGGDASVLLTQSDYGGWAADYDKAFPIPSRGYAVRALIIRNRPVLNSSGVSIPSAGVSTVKIGIMVGAGVIAGATVGVYPGDFLEFAEYSLTASESEKHVEVLWPVIEGCPLAYQSTVGNHVITALVDFQPGVNVGFVMRDGADLVQQGDYSGKPYFHSHLSHATDSNEFDILNATVQLPLSARMYNDLYTLLNSL